MMFDLDFGRDAAQIKLAIVLLAKKKITIKEKEILENIIEGFKVDIGRYNEMVKNVNKAYVEPK